MTLTGFGVVPNTNLVAYTTHPIVDDNRCTSTGRVVDKATATAVCNEHSECAGFVCYVDQVQAGHQVCYVYKSPMTLRPDDNQSLWVKYNTVVNYANDTARFVTLFPTPSQQTPPTSPSSSSNAGAIAAGVLIPLILLTIAAIAFTIYYRRKNADRLDLPSVFTSMKRQSMKSIPCPETIQPQIVHVPVENSFLICNNSRESNMSVMSSVGSNHPTTWSPVETALWLKLKLVSADLIDTLFAANVTGAMLLEMTPYRLNLLGIPQSLESSRLLGEVDDLRNRWGSSTAAAAAPPEQCTPPQYYQGLAASPASLPEKAQFRPGM
ncbi:hypothetical protein HDU97_005409 [Phlyctochytrium planicorne]|nr:hypothetical protein HDU97_005409 [Phlyctochytrium planicorne]